MTTPGVAPALFRQLLGRFVTGVTILTTTDATGEPVGMTANSLASVSLTPPLVLVAVSRERDIHPALLRARYFGFSVLAADQEELSRRFAGDHADRFRGVPYGLSARGVPTLDGVVATIECEKHAEVAAGDHTVFIGLVVAGSTAERGPLLYYRGAYARLNN